VKRERNQGHSGGEASGSSADKLSKADEHLLVGPERGLGAQSRDHLKEARALKVRRGV